MDIARAQFDRLFSDFDKDRNNTIDRTEFDGFVGAAIEHERRSEREGLDRLQAMVFGDNELIDRYGRCSCDTLVRLNSEIAEIDRIIGNREALSAKSLFAALAVAIFIAQHAVEWSMDFQNQDGSQ